MRSNMVQSNRSAKINITRIAGGMQLHLQLHGKEYMKTGLLLGVALMMFMVTGCRKEPRPRPDAGTKISGFCSHEGHAYLSDTPAECVARGGTWGNN